MFPKITDKNIRIIQGFTFVFMMNVDIILNSQYRTIWMEMMSAYPMKKSMKKASTEPGVNFMPRISACGSFFME
ncbi:hypothetical protein WK22_02575 [Burkholderia multivorans]|nr:hypothetical protein WK22_02575 [Burkholderia multivorans]